MTQILRASCGVSGNMPAVTFPLLVTVGGNRSSASERGRISSCWRRIGSRGRDGTGGFREARNRLAHILKRLCCLGISEAVSQVLVEAGAAAAAESKEQLRGHQWKKRKKCVTSILK